MGRLHGGLMDERVIFQSYTVVRGNMGGEAKTWTTTFTDWAQVSEMQGKEKFEATQLTAEKSVKLVMRYRTNVNVKMRFIWDSTFYEIVSVQEIQREAGIIVLGKLVQT